MCAELHCIQMLQGIQKQRSLMILKMYRFHNLSIAIVQKRNYQSEHNEYQFDFSVDPKATVRPTDSLFNFNPSQLLSDLSLLMQLTGYVSIGYNIDSYLIVFSWGGHFRSSRFRTVFQITILPTPLVSQME